MIDFVHVHKIPFIRWCYCHARYKHQANEQSELDRHHHQPLFIATEVSIVSLAHFD
jgi:hypothetical protein